MCTLESGINVAPWINVASGNFDKMLVLYMTQNGNTVELGDKELFGHPKIVP